MDEEPKQTLGQRLSVVWSWICGGIFFAIVIVLFVMTWAAVLSYLPPGLANWPPPKEYELPFFVMLLLWGLAKLIEIQFSGLKRHLGEIQSRLEKAEARTNSALWQAEDDRRKITEQLNRIEWALDPLLLPRDK